MEMKEWVDVAGVDGMRVNREGQILCRGKGGQWKLRKLQRDKAGYLVVGRRVSGKWVMHKVHRLVAIAFIHNPENFPLVRHRDDVKDNSHVDNLEWGTHKDNIQDAIRNGSSFAGASNGNARLTEETAQEVLSLVCSGMTLADVARRYGVTSQAVGMIVTGKNWAKHTTPESRALAAMAVNGRPKFGRGIVLDGTAYISVSAAAKALGKCRKTIRALVAAGVD